MLKGGRSLCVPRHQAVGNAMLPLDAGWFRTQICGCLVTGSLAGSRIRFDESKNSVHNSDGSGVYFDFRRY